MVRIHPQPLNWGQSKLNVKHMKTNDNVIRFGINGNVKIPYAFQPGELVLINFEDPAIPPFKAIISSVKINTTRPRYDVDVVLANNKTTRIHSIDSWYVEGFKG